jgi:hypothetical protein
MSDKNQINKRIQARYDFLMEQGKHGHYETMFRCVHEELATREAQVQAEEQEKVRGLVESLSMIKNWGDSPIADKHMIACASSALATYNQHTEKKG